MQSFVGPDRSLLTCLTPAYYVAYGAHGPRKSIGQPGSAMKIVFGTLLGVSIGVGCFYAVRSQGTYLLCNERPCANTHQPHRHQRR